jgi:selenocysteine-specific elongation factor
MSDSHLNAPRDIVIGTAGHIDHGKTSLVRALTGMDTDRLAEEKRRGISIDLGFAHLPLPGGKCVSFVDVPGHERFVRNMLAGACGIEAVLLVIAAEESVKPQTREHFDICRLLGVTSGIVVLTKCDLATPEQLAVTRAAVDHLRSGSFLATAPVIETSSVTRHGFARLMDAFEQLIDAKTSRITGGLARLPLDRSFALKGFGTIVTGTLWSGALRVGDMVQLHPSGQEARIRGLQIHGKAVQVATAGQRTAVNLSGSEHSKIGRGFVLTHPNSLESTRSVEASIDWLSNAGTPGAHENFLLHIGTSEITARIQTLSPTLIRLKLAEPIIALPGDRFVLRRPSPAQTIGGGSVVDAFPPSRPVSNCLLAIRRTDDVSKNLRKSPAGQVRN